MPISLTGRVALVTGASRGIGAAIARALAEAGADVAINYRNRAAEAEAVAEQVRPSAAVRPRRRRCLGQRRRHRRWWRRWKGVSAPSTY